MSQILSRLYYLFPQSPLGGNLFRQNLFQENLFQENSFSENSLLENPY